MPVIAHHLFQRFLFRDILAQSGGHGAGISSFGLSMSDWSIPDLFPPQAGTDYDNIKPIVCKGATLGKTEFTLDKKAELIPITISG